MRSFLITLVALVLVVSPGAFAQSTASGETSAAERIAYGSNPEQYGELRLPAGRGPFPVAILLHGGCFIAEMFSATGFSAFADSLRHAGIATWNVEYRRVNSPGGGWPETFRDVGRAADHVRALATRYPLDTTRTIAVGHSAGGFLALWLGGRRGIAPGAELHSPDPMPLRAVVALGADGDLPPIAATLARLCRRPVVGELLGADSVTANARRVQANPADMAALAVRQVLVVGDRDVFETPALRDAYVARTRRKSEVVDVITIPGASHFDVADPRSAAWPIVRRVVSALVQSQQ